MTTRLLPRAEWPRLAGTELEDVCAALPQTAQVVAVEDETGALIGCWAAFPVLHVEGVWIAPAHRGKTTVARRLWRAMGETLRSVFQTTAACTSAVTPDIEGLLRNRATRLPGTHYIVSWKG